MLAALGSRERIAAAPTKTHVGNCLLPGQGFEFLGYRFKAGRRYSRDQSLTQVKDRIRQETRRTAGLNLTQIIATPNPVLRGWLAYFKHAQRTTYPPLDGFIRRRLRAIFGKQAKRPGRGHTAADHRR